MKQKAPRHRLLQTLRRPAFVLTALSSLAGMAHAQANVEIFGLLDIGYLYTSADGNGSVSSINTVAVRAGVEVADVEQTEDFDVRLGVGHCGNRRQGSDNESGTNFHGQDFQNVDKEETRKSGAGA